MALLVFEVLYVAVGNYLIRGDILTRLVNKKPEKTHISWDSASTWLPGVVTVEGFTLRSQTRRDQVSLHVVEADARIGLVKLLSKTIHIRGVDARDVDFRYRERLDRPPGKKQEEQPEGPPENLEYWPEIPGLTNPPDPRPEDLYTMKKKKRPWWAISITGVAIDQGKAKIHLSKSRKWFEDQGPAPGEKSRSAASGGS